MGGGHDNSVSRSPVLPPAECEGAGLRDAVRPHERPPHFLPPVASRRAGRAPLNLATARRRAPSSGLWALGPGSWGVGNTTLFTAQTRSTVARFPWRIATPCNANFETMTAPIFHVYRCVSKRGGGYLITTNEGPSAWSLMPWPEGAAIQISAGGEALQPMTPPPEPGRARLTY